MTRAQKILEAILDPSQDVSDVFDRRGFFQKSIEQRLRFAIQKVAMKGRDVPNALLDKRDLFTIIKSLNMSFSSTRNKVKFDIAQGNIDQTKEPILGGFHAWNDLVVVKINRNSVYSAWFNIDRVIIEIRSTLYHEMIHRKQLQRHPKPSPKFLGHYQKVHKELGREEFKRYYNTPEEIMAFSGELVDVIIQTRDYSKILDRLRHYIRVTGKDSHAMKKLLRYMIDYAVKRGINQKVIVGILNRAITDIQRGK